MCLIRRKGCQRCLAPCDERFDEKETRRFGHALVFHRVIGVAGVAFAGSRTVDGDNGARRPKIRGVFHHPIGDGIKLIGINDDPCERKICIGSGGGVYKQVKQVLPVFTKLVFRIRRAV